MTGAGRAEFSAASTQAVLRTACAKVGLDPTGAELIRLGENALYRLAREPVVVRIARTMDYWDDATNEVNVARWLASHAFPAVEVCDLPQPVQADGRPVTFWRYIDGQPGTRNNIATLAAMLRRLHQLPAPTDFALPEQNLLDRIGPRIEAAPVTSGDKDFLLDRWDELTRTLPTLAYPLRSGPTHGDAHVGNLMLRDGAALLLDFERFSWGQPEWDLALTATEYLTAGWWTQDEYRAFADTYGYDVTAWAGFPLLRATHEIKMTTWLMQNVAESSVIADEFDVRMRTMRTGQADHGWQPF